MLDLDALTRWAHEIEDIAHDVRQAERVLAGAVAATRWHSAAADRFREDAHEHARRLALAADDLVEAAAGLRAHAAVVRSQEASLGAAAAAVLAAARAAAVEGVAAVAPAMAAAERAFEELAGAAREGVEPRPVMLDPRRLGSR